MLFQVRISCADKRDQYLGKPGQHHIEHDHLAVICQSGRSGFPVARDSDYGNAETDEKEEKDELRRVGDMIFLNVTPQ